MNITYGAILELQFIKNKKEQKASESDDLFEDERDFNKEDDGDHKEILSVTLKIIKLRCHFYF